MKPALKHTLAIALLLTATHTWADQTCKKSSISESTPDSQLTDNENGTVTDTKTGLMWMQCSEGQTRSTSGGTTSCTGTATTHTWKAALELAQDKTFAGYSDWRLPNLKELRSLAEVACFDPAINLTRFPDTPSAKFWSSMPSSGSFSSGVDFVSGSSAAGSSDRSAGARVRLVRAGN